MMKKHKSTILLTGIFSALMLSSGNLRAQDYLPGIIQKNAVFKWPEGKQLAISLTFDDARLSQTDRGIPLLDKYGVKGTFYISPDNLLKRTEEWKRALVKGHEIGNHSVVHPCSGNFEWSRNKALEDYTLGKMRAELDSAGRFIKNVFGAGAVSFAYPCGQTYVGNGTGTKSYIPLVAAMFESGRGWMNENPNDPLYCNMSQLTGIELDGKTFEQVKAIIELARTSGRWIVFAGHEMGDGGRQTSLLSTIEELCKYANDPANGILIDNVHNIASYVRSQRGENAFTPLPPYKDPLLTVNQRVEDLLSRMTLAEKIGQMNMPCVYVSELGRDIPAKTEATKKLTEGKFADYLGPAGGFFTLANTILHEGTLQQANYFNELQKIAIDKTRLGIPLLETEEGTHGLMCTGGTIFPEGLALGSTWNMDLIGSIYTIAAREARAVGIHQIFTLVVEPNRDPRLGRNQEGYSEDPYFCSRMAETIVNAVQGSDISASDKTVAGLCHYPGQSEPNSGMERGAMEISERKLREVFLPPWVAGIKKAGALGVMATYPAIDGVPTHGSEFILTKILRDELGFKGLVLSEGGGLGTLLYTGLAANEAETGEMAIRAGLDVGISFEEGFLKPMIDNVSTGKVSMQLIDRAVRRILEQKFRLGLFENPFVDAERAVRVTHTAESRNTALQAAREGIVLLKNQDNILPVKKDLKRIAVIGPNADDEKNQLGDYTAIVVSQDITTVLDGIRSKVSKGTVVDYIKGCNVTGTDLNEIKQAVASAKKADLAVVVLGENEWRSPNKTGTVGEGYDVASLDLTGMQEELLKAVKETGTPVIMVLINGRPLSIRWAAENIKGIIEAWIPGEAGGEAVADIIFGDVNPGGKLTVTIPRHVGQLPFYYNYMPEKLHWINEGWGKAYADIPATPLWEFGFGLSYTTFEYSSLKTEPSVNGPFGEFVISADIKNSGRIKGSEVAQLYIRDLIASVTNPVRELKGFEKITLEPGETKRVEFRLTHDDLAFYNRNMEWIVEPGEFDIMVGSSSKDIRLKGKIEVK
jgi:beta-glucosidase